MVYGLNLHNTGALGGLFFEEISAVLSLAQAYETGRFTLVLPSWVKRRS